MLFVSILTSDRSRDPELWATIWQGDPPPSINLIGAYNLGSDKRVFIWKGESVADTQFMDRFNEIGVLETFPAFDRTEGWRAAFAKDIDGFRERLERSSSTAAQSVDSAIALRTLGMTAENRHEARLRARLWVTRQEGDRSPNEYRHSTRKGS